MLRPARPGDCPDRNGDRNIWFGQQVCDDISYEITLPADVALRVYTYGGNVDIAGFANSVDAKSLSGFMDVAADFIPRELTARDNIGNSNFTGIFLDTYHDQLNGYAFIVTSSGVQLDLCSSLAGDEQQFAAYQRNRDNTCNAFNADAGYLWWFAPGSQISGVWKNAGSTHLQANEATSQFFDNFNNTINTPYNNSLSVKVLDYLTLRKGSGRVAAR